MKAGDSSLASTADRMLKVGLRNTQPGVPANGVA
jgi:hypothetical protein